MNKISKSSIKEVFEEMEWFRGYFSNHTKRLIQFTIEKYSEQLKTECKNSKEKIDFIYKKLDNEL
ncbi:MAG TPA: hypothetical protein QF753_02145 [Victivallales bacterium]|nr:hypothetical protein [Victivallales bacterium]